MKDGESDGIIGLNHRDPPDTKDLGMSRLDRR
jgi:hypothetical protein